MRLNRASRVVVAPIALLLACALASCGSGQATSSGGKASTAYLDKIDARVNTYLSKTGTYAAPPATSPAPAKGKKIALISCGQSYPTCAEEIAAAGKAADTIGWQSKVFDSKGDPGVAGAAIRSAIASGYDGIFIYYTDCRYVKAPLEEAKAAKIPVVASESADCGTGSNSLYSNGGAVIYNGANGPMDFLSWIKDWSASQVWYAIDHTKGKAKMLGFGETSSNVAKAQVAAMKSAGAGCKTCTFDMSEFPISDLGTKLQGEAEQELLKHPDADVVLPSYESILISGVGAAVKGAGRKVLMTAGEGTEASTEFRTSGLAQFGVGFAYGWEGFAAIDDLNRIFNGQKPANSGIGIQLYDKQHNWPGKGAYVPPFDYEAAYKKAWGAS